MSDNADEWMRASEVAPLIGKSVWTVYRMEDAGRFPRSASRTRGEHRRYRRREIEAFVRGDWQAPESSPDPEG